MYSSHVIKQICKLQTVIQHHAPSTSKINKEWDVLTLFSYDGCLYVLIMYDNVCFVIRIRSLLTYFLADTIRSKAGVVNQRYVIWSLEIKLIKFKAVNHLSEKHWTRIWLSMRKNSSFRLWSVGNPQVIFKFLLKRYHAIETRQQLHRVIEFSQDSLQQN